MISRLLQLTHIFASLAALVIVCMPSVADALALWGDAEPSGCFEGAVIDTSAFATEDVSVALEPDCEGIHPDDPSFNTCFEEAEAPISSFPQLLAEMRAEKVFAMVADTALEVSDALVAGDAPDLSQDEQVVVRLRPAPLDPYDEPECSSYSVRCGAMPSLPSLLSLDAAANGFPIPRVEFDYPSFLEWPSGQRHTSRYGPGPADGFGKPLVPPPRMA